MSMLTSAVPMTRERQALEAEALDQRYPIPLHVRALIVEKTLEYAGLQKSNDGDLMPSAAPRKHSARTRLSAMRLLASFDRLSLQHRKLDLLEYPMGEKPEPEPEPEDEDTSDAADRAADEALERFVAYEAAQRAANPAWKPASSSVKKPEPDRVAREIHQRWP